MRRAIIILALLLASCNPQPDTSYTDTLCQEQASVPFPITLYVDPETGEVLELECE